MPAKSPCDPRRLILLDVDRDALAGFGVHLRSRAKLGEFAGLVHGDVPQLLELPDAYPDRGMRACHACFQGLTRPLNKDMGIQLFAYVSSPPCSFVFDDPFDVCRTTEKPLDSVFVTYVEFSPETVTMLAALQIAAGPTLADVPDPHGVVGTVRGWEWVPAELPLAPNPALHLPRDHGRRYVTRRW